MKAIIGLGNPGNSYAGTRHNVGTEVVELLLETLSIRLGPGKGPFHVAKGRYQSQQILCIQPATYMNRSGEAVASALNWYKIPVEDCLICYDDLNLPVGKIRLRPGGSAGGHNGIRDIIQKLGTNSFPRLRIGIGNDFPQGRQADYVLSRFKRSELKPIREALQLSRDAALCFCTEGIEEAMNRFN